MPRRPERPDFDFRQPYSNLSDSCFFQFVGSGRASMIRIAVDAMGGDKGPRVVTRGVMNAAVNSSSHFLIVGDPAQIEPELRSDGAKPSNIEIVPAMQIIEMTEHPVEAFKKKPDASVVVSAQLVREGKADGFVTIANTGAAVAVSLLTLKRIKGIDRPAIATTLPAITGRVVLLDAGATPDCESRNLYEFALMGCAFRRRFTASRVRSSVCFRSARKTRRENALSKRTYALFKEMFGSSMPFDFIGNVEGKDIYRGSADVVVCDGFVGNTVLKTSEGVAEMILKLLKEELERNKLILPLLMPFKSAFREVRKKIDYSEHGGAPLLGVNGVCIIGHGRSNENAVKNACLAAEKAIQYDLVETIKQRVTETPAPHQKLEINRGTE